MNTAELIELPRADCLRLLAGHTVGRVVFTEAALPAAHPVTYLLDGEEVVFRTADGGKLAAATVHRVVAFEVDEIDLDAGTGWSVLGVGEAYEVTEPGRLADLTARTPPPWLPDRDGHTVAVPLQRLTGRQLSRESAGDAVWSRLAQQAPPGARSPRRPGPSTPVPGSSAS